MSPGSSRHRDLPAVNHGLPRGAEFRKLDLSLSGFDKRWYDGVASNIQIVAKVLRGETVESVHCGSVAVVDRTGRLTHAAGDPDLVTMARSCIKPFQLIPLLLSGAADEYGFSPRQLAIMCGSHAGSDEHKQVVHANLELTGHCPEDLQCGTIWPLGMQARREFPLKGEDKDPCRHDCSGKHSGFLALAKFLGDEKETYLDPESRSQQMIKQAVSDFCEYPVENMPAAIDGCSAPNFPLALRNIALGFKKLAGPDAADDALAQVVARIKDAMTRHPEMVSGEDRFDLALMRSFPDNIVAKVGAEAVEGIGFADPPVGIAVKIGDGNFRALVPVCVEVLRQLGIIKDIKDFPLLQKYERPDVLNDRSIVTGQIIPEFELRRVS